MNQQSLILLVCVVLGAIEKTRPCRSDSEILASLPSDKNRHHFRVSAGLLVGTYLFAIAKSTNVNDLQNALKTRTLIFDREEKRQAPYQVKREPMLN